MRYIIPLPPVTKKNSQQILVNRASGKPFVMPSKKFLEYEKQAKAYLGPKPETAIDYPVNVRCVFCTPTRRKVDLTNLLEAVDDLLVTAGILEDDNSRIVAGHDGSRVIHDRDNPRTEIEIERMCEDERRDGD